MTAPHAERPIRERVLAGETLFGLFLDLDSPASAELAGRAGSDWLLVDLEHGSATEATLLAHLYAIETTGAAALVRPQSGERMRIGRALDLGAAGIMVPRLDSAAEAREAVTYLRYPPDGIRGVATRTRGAGLGSRSHAEIRGVNDSILGIVQIESRGGLRDAAEIASIDGVDVLFVGPADLSHSLAIPGRFDDPAYQAALDTVVAACRASGKAAGILIYDTAAVAGYVERGFTFVGIGADGAFVADTAARALAAVRG
jgi:2-dehydro-3-deoxyglucarate aldolase/4-hydroxy-2-oxoheptanedioate aldolase